MNRDTVALAYDGLARDGAVETTVGRGTFVRHAATVRTSPPSRTTAATLAGGGSAAGFRARASRTTRPATVPCPCTP